MTSNLYKFAIWAGILVTLGGLPRMVPRLNAQQSSTTAEDALQKARVLERLAETKSGRSREESLLVLCSILHGPSRCLTTGSSAMSAG